VAPRVGFLFVRYLVERGFVCLLRLGRLLLLRGGLLLRSGVLPALSAHLAISRRGQYRDARERYDDGSHYQSPRTVAPLTAAMGGAVVAENRTPQQGRCGNRCAHAGLVAHCLFYLFGGAGNHDFDGDPLSLRPKRRPTLVLEDERASRVDGVSREDSFVGLACDRARLAALSVDEANDRSARTRRPGRPGRAGRSLLALFALGAGRLLLLFASRKRRKRQERQQHGNHQHTNLHGRHAPSLSRRIWRSGG